MYVDAFGCFFVSSNVKAGKNKQNLSYGKKSLDLFDQFIRMAEREIDIM